MIPTHSNKQGARYRYYVSHAVLQKRDRGSGSIARVPAQEIESAVVRTVRDHLKGHGGDEHSPLADRELIEKYVERVTIRRQTIEIHLVNKATDPSVIETSWAGAAVVTVKGILNSPSSGPAMSEANRDLLLTAIARARAWIEDIADGRVASFAEIAGREGKVERHIRLLAPLAFVSPKLISTICDGSQPVTGVTELAKKVPYYWSEQTQEK